MLDRRTLPAVLLVLVGCDAPVSPPPGELTPQVSASGAELVQVLAEVATMSEFFLRVHDAVPGFAGRDR